ncbi:MAG: flavodoxin-dependent (E)-4-hydroxy-3-methylbut-2-enyl-diphosphate synthase, partial [Oscillospiraceae bacterium]|nr:flavodoxin-dependent (E)-4-hydroxy-3-methylbut-2-enyl-diphosphate synthase [Oscillospiraceae bacterium]
MDNREGIPPGDRRGISVGGVAVGAGARVTVQSMTNTKTSDVAATAAQIARLRAAGCDIVRVAVPDMDSALAVGKLKKLCGIPIVADIHFDYRLAIAAARAGADKIRINPGNIGGSERVRAVADCCRERGIPIRVGE